MKCKRVELECLKEFKELLLNKNNKNLDEYLQEINNYFDEHIMSNKLMTLTELKKAIYSAMMGSKKDIVLNKKYYNLYQKLKNNQISTETAMDEFLSI